MNELPKKTCSRCGETKSEKRFFLHHPVCRSCNKKEIDARPRSEPLTLEEKAAAHLQKKQVREEMKKIARENLQDRKRHKKARARAALVPTIDPEYKAPDSATQELARRELARRKLIEFVQQFHPRYHAGWVHHDICAKLEKFSHDVAAAKSPRLMILMPPRHGKSQLASKLWPAWHLGHYPHHEFIGCSYAIDLAMDFSREIRDIIASDQYHTLFPKTVLNPSFMSASAWKLLSETAVGSGGYNAAGVGGGITGKGAHCLVIDDPVKNAEEAESPDIRKKIWNWYQSTAYTRLAPGGGVLVIQTWWHDDDLAGRLQKEMEEDPEADQFVIVKYPAIAEDDEEFRMKGEALHTARYPLEALLKIKRTLGTNYWSALYQQAPVSEEGAYFTEDMFLHPPEWPQVDELDIYQAWDLAISDEQVSAGNYTVGVTLGLNSDGNIFVLERQRMKTNDTSIIEDAIIDMYSRYKVVSGFGIEDGQISRTLKKSLKKRMLEKQVYMPLDDKSSVLKPIKSKMVRARPLQGRMQNRRVWFPKGQAWVDEMIKEFVRFPAGAQDDQIDAMAWGVILLSDRSPPQKRRTNYRKPELTVAQKLAKFVGQTGVGTHMGS